MGDQIWPIGQEPINVIDSSSLDQIATVTFDPGKETLYGCCRIGDDVYIFTQTNSGVGPTFGQFVLRFHDFLQAAQIRLNPVALGNLYNGGVATDGDLIYAMSVAGFGLQCQIFVLDPTTLAVLDSSSFGPTSGVALSSPFTPAYANGRIFSGVVVDTFPTVEDFLCVIDTATLTATTFTMGTGILSCLASPDQSTVYALGNGVIYVVDTTSLAITPVSIGGALQFQGATLSPNGQILWITDAQTIWVLDTTTFAIIHTINVHGLGTRGMVMTSDGSAVFVSGDVGKISTSSYAITGLLVGGSDLNWVDIPGPRPVVPPPTLQRPRDDNLGLGAPRQRVGPAQPSSRQYSIRQGGRGTYS